MQALNALIQPRGFSLTELLLVLAMLSVLVGIGAPSLGAMQSQAMLRSERDGIFSLFQAGRGLAISHAQAVTVCGSADGVRCELAAWNTGALLFLDRNRNGVVDGADSVIRHHSWSSNGAVLVRGNREKTVFAPDGTAGGSNQSVQLCAADAGVSVVVSNEGRVRIGVASC